MLGGDVLDVPLALIVAVALLGAGRGGGHALALAAAPGRPSRNPTWPTCRWWSTDVVKTYADGFRAVDGISFRAEPGQVVGLLGPNGAGKTTAIRMLVGLIRPDAGEIFVHGEPVHAGADVLASVGAFIEGPGFLPHLTGRQNLDAYWQATGRPPEEAHLEEALEIAGLGTALDRKVRGYSQGMRQRLGIAQAMLGPAVAAGPGRADQRARPAADQGDARRCWPTTPRAGRTVVISSHLLGEVEQTCTHVVVMDQGRSCSTGSVSSADRQRHGDHDRAGRRAGPGRGRAASRCAGSIGRTGGRGAAGQRQLPRADIVRELVSRGYRVESVDGRRQLEEVFLSLVGGPSERRTPMAERDGDG